MITQQLKVLVLLALFYGEIIVSYYLHQLKSALLIFCLHCCTTKCCKPFVFAQDDLGGACPKFQAVAVDIK